MKSTHVFHVLCHHCSLNTTLAKMPELLVPKPNLGHFGDTSIEVDCAVYDGLEAIKDQVALAIGASRAVSSRLQPTLDYLDGLITGIDVKIRGANSVTFSLQGEKDFDNEHDHMILYLDNVEIATKKLGDGLGVASTGGGMRIGLHANGADGHGVASGNATNVVASWKRMLSNRKHREFGGVWGEAYTGLTQSTRHCAGTKIDLVVAHCNRGERVGLHVKHALCARSTTCYVCFSL